MKKVGNKTHFLPARYIDIIQVKFGASSIKELVYHKIYRHAIPNIFRERIGFFRLSKELFDRTPRSFQYWKDDVAIPTFVTRYESKEIASLRSQ